MSSSPDPVQINALVTLINTGQWQSILPLAQAMTQQFPDFSFGWAMLGASLRAVGRHSDALEPSRRVVKLAPTEPESHLNLGNVLQDLGKDQEAVECFEQALALNEAFVPAMYNLANLLMRMERHGEALSHYLRALQMTPDATEIYFNAALACLSLNHVQDAIAHLTKAVSLDPAFLPGLRELGVLLSAQGQTLQAWDCLMRALRIDPNDVTVLAASSDVLLRLKRYAEAKAVTQQWLNKAPEQAHGHVNMGHALRATGALVPALASFQAALSIQPANVSAWIDLGLTLNSLARPSEAATAYRQALSVDPNSRLAYTNLIYALVHDADVSAEDLRAETARFAQQFEAPLMPHWPVHKNTRDPDRVIRVGFVSADFRNHAVTVIFQPLLNHLALQSGLELHGFYVFGESDAMTAEVRARFAHWHEVAHLDDQALAQKIQDLSIDILIDLSGHTGHNRLLAFARKPAPVQVSWLGFLASTGLRAMDYYLADDKLYPLGLMDGVFTEKLVYLPATNPFFTSPFAPPVNALPALQNGHVTFGSFNRPAKISRACVKVWSALLRALPSSRLVMGGIAHEPDNVARVEAWFVEDGIDAARISYLPRGGIAEYLSWHHQVDMALDTFPYTGGTTTSNALSMGVPTLTLAGTLPTSRGGPELLGFVGLDDFVSHDANEFVQRGVWWSGHLRELADIRVQLRDRLRESPLGHPEDIAAAFNRALRKMWQTWCKGDVPRSFKA